MTVLAKPTVVIGGNDTPLMAALARSEARVASAGRRMGKLGATLRTRVTLPLVALGGAAVAAFGSFDSAMTQSTAIMGDVSAAMRGEMEAAARDVARTTTLSATKAAQSYFYLASAGFDAKQAIAALPAVARFAQAGMFDMAKATSLAADAQSALGLKVDDAQQNLQNMTRVTDVLVRANTLANANVEQFSTALTSQAAAAMKTFGQSVEEGVAVLSAFADQGIKAERAGMGYSRILRLMTQAATKNKGAMKELGISFFDAQGKLRPMADIVENLTTVLGPMSDEQRTAALTSIGFTARVQGMLLPLLGTSKAIRRYQKELEKASGFTKDVAEKQLKSFNSQMKIAWNNVVIGAQAMGRVLAPAVLGTARVFSGLAQRLAELNPGTLKMVALAAALAAALGPAVTLAGLFVSSVGALIGVLSTAAAGVTAAVGAVGSFIAILNPAGLAALALASAVLMVPGALQTMADIARGSLNFFVGLLRFVGTVAKIVWDDYLKKPFVAAFNRIRDLGGRVLSAVASALETVGRLGKGAADAIRSAFQDAGSTADEEGAGLGAKIAQAALDSFSTDYVGEMGRVVGDALARAQARVAQLLQQLRSMATGNQGGGGAAQEANQFAVNTQLANQNMTALAGTVQNLDLSEAFRVATQGAHALGAVGQSVASSIGANFENAFTSIITGTAKAGKAFANLAKAVLADLARMIAKMLVFTILSSLIPGFGQASAALGGAALFTGGGFGGFRAGGGPVSAGRSYVVGERRPELFTPNTSGRITPLQGSGADAGAVAGAILDQVGPPPGNVPPSTAAAHAWWRRVYRKLQEDHMSRYGS